MKKKLVIKWLLRIFVLLMVLTVATLIWSNQQLKGMYGTHTEKVNPNTFQPKKGVMAIRHAQVLSPDGKAFLPNHTIIFDQEHIVEVLPDSNFKKDLSSIDGTDTYVIPGLVDSHVHLQNSENDLLLYVANGITGIREMKGNKRHLTWREEINKGRLGPRMIVTSTKLQSHTRMAGWFHRWSRGDINIAFNTQKQAFLKQLEKDGYDAIKLGTHLSPQDYRSIQEAAAYIDIPITGHIPFSIGLEDFWNSQQYEVAHIEEFVKAIINRYYREGLQGKGVELMDFVKENSLEIAQKLVDRNTAVVSTLWLMESLLLQKVSLDSLLQAKELEYVNPGIVEGWSMAGVGWLPDLNFYQIPDGLPEEEIKRRKAYWIDYIKSHHLFLTAMIEKGVIILAGTDTNLPVVVPGFSLHDELISLVNGGMSTEQALKSATSLPNEWMGVNAGKIAPGFLPDLLILHKNPLDNIAHTQSIKGVISAGNFYDSALLLSMLDAIKEANMQSRRKDISQWTSP